VAARRHDFLGILDADLERMAEIGRPIVEAQREQVLAAVATGVRLTDSFGEKGLTALAVRTRRLQNEVGEHICLLVAAGGLGYDLAVLYYSKNPTTWVHSLRSNGGTDCARLAAKMGGGGHPNAASFLAKEPVVPRSVGQKEV